MLVMHLRPLLALRTKHGDNYLFKSSFKVKVDIMPTSSQGVHCLLFKKLTILST
jgi:hypothetical protein